MPLVQTAVNVDFDEKQEFIRLFGKAELSAFVRQMMKQKIEEKKQKKKNELASGRDDLPILSADMLNEDISKYADIYRDDIHALVKINVKPIVMRRQKLYEDLLKVRVRI